ncbi:type II secretion system protein N [Colwellia maritima]|uniref:type II secretion system protein N n=1 Tax=Colwellia maritima TaxID=2912588 RepID=UPI00237B9400|nr:type II secretion system protein N [Colwellia maritima]
MKNKFAMGGIFLIAYLVFLIATLPTTFVLNQVSLPNNIKNSIQYSGVSGSIWQTNIAQMAINGTRIEKVHADLSFWSLFSLAPKIAITFGDSFSAGPEGKVELVLSQEKAKDKRS